MKKQILSCLTLTVLAFSPLSAQIVVDAGPEKAVCVDWHGIMDTLSIGGYPTASGGVEPYTYTWEADYAWSIGDYTFTFSASDFLNDTTLANPEVIYAIGDTIEFRLSVDDAEGNTDIDTTNVYFAYFSTHLGNVTYTINQGDSVYLHGMQNVFGGFPPYEYLWRPNHGLSDSTSLAFWAKPEYSVAYYLTKTDSAGCVVTGAPVYYVNVQPVMVEEHEAHQSMVKAYPNPVKDILNLQINPSVQGAFTLRLFLTNGKLIKKQQFKGNTLSVDMMGYPTGVYVYEILNEEGLVEQGRFVVK